MFSAVAQKCLADAKQYFDEHLAQNDYYAAGEFRPGQWVGVGAERLGLTSAVTRDQFHALCENHHPGTGERLTQRTQKEGQRRVFYDFTCSSPKSVSVLAVTLADERLVVAHEESAKGISTAEVREQQWSQLSAAERESRETLRASARATHLPRVALVANQVLNHAIEHVFERKSVVPEHELFNVALAHRLGEVDLNHLKAAVRYSAALVKTERGNSTREILATELTVIQTVNAACDSVDPLNPGYRVADWLGEDQRRAIYQILRTSDRITGLKGLAGTGKTTALKELVAACKAARLEPIFCAPTAAATEVLRKEGFAAVTLQSLLLSRQPPGTLVVLDEAGAVGLDDMKRLFDLGKDSRIILSGDTGQHASVAQGDALRILERHPRLKSGQLTAIRRRRKAAYRRAVELAAQKRTVEAVAQLTRMGAVAEVLADGHPDLHDSAAKSYVKILAENKSVLLVAPTWAEIAAVTEKIRAALKTAGRLSGDEQEFQVFDSLSWTEARKRDARQFRPGMLRRFHRQGHGFEKGELVSVVAVEKDSLTVQRADGTEMPCRLGQGLIWCDVGEKRALRVAAGDKLLLQANAVAGRKPFVNGELVEVKRLAGEAIILTDGRVLPANYRTFTHGYAVMSHAAQGKTVDAVLVVASSRSLPAVHQAQFYVSISRGRERCQVFTDDVDLLRSHVTDSSARLAAIEALPGRRSKILQTIFERGRRFLKRFRQRIAPTLLKERLNHAIKPIEYHQHQRKSRGIGA